MVVLFDGDDVEDVVVADGELLLPLLLNTVLRVDGLKDGEAPMLARLAVRVVNRLVVAGTDLTLELEVAAPVVLLGTLPTDWAYFRALMAFNLSPWVMVFSSFSPGVIGWLIGVVLPLEMSSLGMLFPLFSGVDERLPLLLPLLRGRSDEWSGVDAEIMVLPLFSSSILMFSTLLTILVKASLDFFLLFSSSLAFRASNLSSRIRRCSTL